MSRRPSEGWGSEAGEEQVGLLGQVSAWRCIGHVLAMILARCNAPSYALLCCIENEERRVEEVGDWSNHVAPWLCLDGHQPLPPSSIGLVLVVRISPPGLPVVECGVNGHLLP
jgi:hypothetical protein